MGSTCRIVLYLPNCIGYFRLVLILIAYLLYAVDDPAVFVGLYSVSFLLDGVDGYVARKLNQVTAFGAWLDVLVDIVSRGLLWCYLYPALGYLIASVEWLVFLCSHSQLGKSWKEAKNAPRYVQMIMQKNFKTLPGVFVVGSLFLLPLGLYAERTGLALMAGFSPTAHMALLLTLSIGRLAAFSVESWFILIHIEYLLSEHVKD